MPVAEFRTSSRSVYIPLSGKWGQRVLASVRNGHYFMGLRLLFGTAGNCGLSLPGTLALYVFISTKVISKLQSRRRALLCDKISDREFSLRRTIQRSMRHRLTIASTHRGPQRDLLSGEPVSGSKYILGACEIAWLT